MKTSISIFIITMILGGYHFASAAEQDPDQEKLEQALADQKEGQHKNAIKILKRIFNKSEALHQQAFQGLLVSYKNTNKFDEALDLIRSEIRQNPFTADLRVVLIDFLFEQKQYQNALDEIVFFERLMVRDPRIQKIKFESLKNLGKHAEAIESLTALLKKQPDDAQALFDRAAFYFDLKEYKKAFFDLQKANYLKPNDEQIMTEYTKVTFHIEYYNETKKMGRKCADSFPNNSVCFEYLGRVAMIRKDYGRAIKDFTSATTLDPKNQEVRLLQADSFFISGRISESHSHYSELLKDYPSFEPAAKGLSRTFSMQNRIEELGKMIKKFYKENPQSVWAGVEYTKLLLLVGSKEDAIANMETLSKLTKSPVTYFYQAYFLNQAGNFETALRALDQVNDASMNVDFHKGIVFYNQNKYSEAAVTWKNVPENSAVRKKAQVNMAVALEKLDKSREPAKESNVSIEWILPPL